MSEQKFWAADLTSDLPVSPLTVLKEAASELGQATKGAIEARVELDEDASGSVWQDFDFKLYVPSLGFTHQLFHCEINAVRLYPVRLYISARTDIDDEASFRSKLATYLMSENVTRVIKSLLAQTKQ